MLTLCPKETTNTPGCSFLNCLFKPSCVFSFVYTPAKIQTNLHRYVYVPQQRVFPLQHTERIQEDTEYIRTFSSLLIVDHRTRVFGHGPVPQAYRTLFNLSSRIPLDLILSWIWVTLKFTTGKATIFHTYHSNDLSTCLCNFFLDWSQRCEFSMKPLHDPIGRFGKVTSKKKAC